MKRFTLFVFILLFLGLGVLLLRKQDGDFEEATQDQSFMGEQVEEVPVPDDSKLLSKSEKENKKNAISFVYEVEQKEDSVSEYLNKFTQNGFDVTKTSENIYQIKKDNIDGIVAYTLSAGKIIFSVNIVYGN